MLTPLGAGWDETLTILSGGDQGTEPVLIGGFEGLRVTGNHLNIADSFYEDWADHETLDILVQIYGNGAVLNGGGNPRDYQFLTGTLPELNFPVGGSIPLEGKNNQWNWVLFRIPNPIRPSGGGRYVGFVPADAQGGIGAGGVNGGTIRVQSVPGWVVRSVAIGELGAFGEPEQVNLFFTGEECDPEPITNHAFIDVSQGTSEHMEVLTGGDQTSSFADDIGPEGDKRRAVRTEGKYLNFGITDNYLGTGCSDPRAVKICIEYYDDPAMAGSFFGPDEYATDDQGGTGFYDFNKWQPTRGSGEWVRQSYLISSVNLFGVGTAPLTGGPRITFDPGANVYISRFDLAVVRVGEHPLAGSDPLADCFEDPTVCAGEYGFEAELDLQAGVSNGIAPGGSGGDQEMIQEEAGPDDDKRLSVRAAHGDGTPGFAHNFINFAITDEVFGPSSQPNARLGICVTYWDNPELQGAFFRPEVYRSERGGVEAFARVPDAFNVVIEGTNTWREAYFELPDVKFSGVNQAPQAAARFVASDKIHFTRIRYGVIRDCGPTAGINPLEECKNPVVAVPIGITGIELDGVLGDVSIMWNSVVGKTYLIQASTDLNTWSDLAGGYPDGGATSESTLFTTPAADESGRYYLRVVEE
ncbi:MAG: hypothetical protein P8J87_16150 [Verrucomicrobiales bacterium]|nr:hypothetical protein [Verrucomicrobiales bacterium]